MSTTRIAVDDPSAVGEARRQATELSRQAGFNDVDVGRVALIVTEVGTNIVKHAGSGDILLSADGTDGFPVIDVLSLDRGPGIGDLGAALRDGFSSAGTPGSGFGAMKRLGSTFEVYSRRDGGTVVYAQLTHRPPATTRDLVIAGINVPHPTETVSGDCWVSARNPSGITVLVADGLGHGPSAHAAADAAAVAFRAHTAPPAERVSRIHDALRATRGAAVAVAEIDRDRRTVRFSGVGNIAGTIMANGATRSVVSHHGTAGHDVRRVQEFSYPWDSGAALVLHSDGLMSRWSLEPYPGLTEKHPMVIAGVLFRDFCRGRDDATVVVVREWP